MKTYCKELEELLKKLKPNEVIYISSKGNKYHFIEHRDRRFFFDIPNHSNPQSPFRKALTEEQLCKLLIILIKNKILTTNNFPFKDYRIAAFYGFINILYPKQYVKTKGKIYLAKQGKSL